MLTFYLALLSLLYMLKLLDWSSSPICDKLNLLTNQPAAVHIRDLIIRTSAESTISNKLIFATVYIRS